MLHVKRSFNKNALPSELIPLSRKSRRRNLMVRAHPPPKQYSEMTNRSKPDAANAQSDMELQSAIAKRGRTRKLSTLQQRLQKKLDSGKFRMLNETMYTTTGAESRELMKQNPELFHLYHTAYSEQVKRWPKNPLDDIIAYLKTQKVSMRIADLGCGEARLAREVPQKEVKSFDLVAPNANVIECDIAHVPLPDSSMDIAVFCLSLMGTDYGEFIREARRILVPKGLVIVAEVASRFEDQNSDDFVKGVEQMGFQSDDKHPLVEATKIRQSEKVKRKRGGRNRRKRKQDVEDANETESSKEFFYTFAFRSTKSTTSRSVKRENLAALPTLAACVYKKR